MMNSAPPANLPRPLPEGVEDRLPPVAFARQEVMGHLLRFFYDHGYDFIDPPLIEYTSSLSAVVGAGVADNSFASFDPTSGKSLVVRADMTAGVARIAADKLAHRPRPLKLCYGGDIVTQQPINGKRQLTQVGVEIIGIKHNKQNLLILETLFAALDGILARPLWCDLALPVATRAMLDKLDSQEKILAENYVRHKDVASLTAMKNKNLDGLAALLTTTGLAADVLPQLKKHSGDKLIGASVTAFIELVESAMATSSQLTMPPTLSIDPTELLGFDYKTGYAFTLFDKVNKSTIGRGGHYQVTSNGEEAVGFSLYLDNLLPMIKPSIINQQRPSD